MISDDLTNLLQPRPGEPPFRQGTIDSFDPSDGSNTVIVGGATLTNVPLLNIGDTVNLAAGDVVVLMKLRSAWAILGRVVVPNSEELNTSAVAFETGSDAASNFEVTTSFVTRASFLLPVPVWADRALVTAAVYGSVASNASVVYQVRTVIEGVSSAALSTQVAAGFTTANAMGQTRDFAVTPGSNVTVLGQILAGANVPANAFTAMQLIASGTFSKA